MAESSITILLVNVLIIFARLIQVKIKGIPIVTLLGVLLKSMRLTQIRHFN
jgi:hypothetical protein